MIQPPSSGLILVPVNPIAMTAGLFSRSQTPFGNGVLETPFRAVAWTGNRVSQRVFPNGVWERGQVAIWSEARLRLTATPFVSTFLPFFRQIDLTITYC